MGYELVIRPHSSGKTLAADRLAARLEAVSREGLAPSLKAAAQPSATPEGEAPATPASALAPEAATAEGDQPGESAAPAVPEASSDAPTEAAASPAPSGPWSLPNGEARVAARLYRRDDEIQGADFEVPFGGTEDEFRRVVEFLLEAAKGVDGIVFDPQLGRELVQSSADDVVARWRQAQSWASDVIGNIDDPRGVIEIKPPPPLLSPKAKAVLFILGGFLAVYWVISALLDAALTE